MVLLFYKVKKESSPSEKLGFWIFCHKKGVGFQFGTIRQPWLDLAEDSRTTDNSVHNILIVIVCMYMCVNKFKNVCRIKWSAKSLLGTLLSTENQQDCAFGILFTLTVEVQFTLFMMLQVPHLEISIPYWIGFKISRHAHRISGCIFV